MSQESWIKDIQMEPYTPPGDDSAEEEQSSGLLSAAQLHPSLQIPAGIVWKDKQQEDSCLNLSTCLDSNSTETTIQWKALQQSDFLVQQMVKDPQNPQRGSLPTGSCQIHLGGTAVRLDLVSPIQVVDDENAQYDLVLGSDFVKHYNMEMDLPNHQLKVPDGESCVTIPFIQPRGEMKLPEE